MSVFPRVPPGFTRANGKLTDGRNKKKKKRSYGQQTIPGQCTGASRAAEIIEDFERATNESSCPRALNEQVGPTPHLFLDNDDKTTKKQK